MNSKKEGVKNMKTKCISILLLFAIAIISLNCVAANDNFTDSLQIVSEQDNALQISENSHQNDVSPLENKIVNAENNATVNLKPETYKIHNVQITKNITIQGKGNPRDIIIDGEEKSSIFLIRSNDVHVTFKNITFINGLSDNFGGAISIETGHVTVDNCIFINNTALNNTNAGGISNYGTKKERGYLLVNNSLFINNHADHDGGAITTCYANSYIYNCVFINNSAHRDGGAIRVSVYGFGDVQDCIFMFNHADEWGGAYYSWSGTSDIKRCIFLNNTAGTNGGAVMASGNLNLQESIIMNNDGGETGGSFYIQQPMYNQKTEMNVHDNLITNNTSPYGKEIFIKWKNSYNLYTQFDNNDWGSEDPNDSSVIDPDNVTPRSKVSKTIKSDLFTKLNVDLLNRYSDLLEDYFPDDSLEDLNNKFIKPESENNPKDKTDSKAKTTPKETIKEKTPEIKKTAADKTNVNSTTNVNENTQNSQNSAVGNSASSPGETNNDKKAYELNETPTVSKKTEIDLKYFIAIIIFTLILLAVGYKRNLNKE